VRLYARQAKCRDRGAALIEYLLLVALIAIACLAALTAIGGDVGDSLSVTASVVSDSVSSSGG